MKVISQAPTGKATKNPYSLLILVSAQTNLSIVMCSQYNWGMTLLEQKGILEIMKQQDSHIATLSPSQPPPF
jgi:hypothetical protein